MYDPKNVLEKYRNFAGLNPKLKQALVLDYLPFEHYRVYEEWKPDTVKVLFIAEAPSWHEEEPGEIRYFYNTKTTEGLSKFIPTYLRMKPTPKIEMLREFKSKGYFLIDTIKCIFKKDVMKAIPDKLIRFSAREILEMEIERLNCKSIFVLGSTALNGLRSTDRFSSALASLTSIGEACGNSIDIGGTIFTFSVFPNTRNTRNRKYQDAINKAFRHLV